jgi:hypothetical protein
MSWGGGTAAAGDARRGRLSSWELVLGNDRP